VLFAKNVEEDHAPASLVKLMTLYLAHEDLEAGRATWDEPVVASPRAAKTPASRIGLRAGETVPLGLLLEAVAIASANDAALAVAEHLGGDEESFVARMNAKARELGLDATRFANPHGLPDPAQRSTARDLALLTDHLLHDYPEVRALLSRRTLIFRGRVYNRHIPPLGDPRGGQALKTGFTREAGYNLALAAWRDGHRFLGILLGSQTRGQSFVDAQRLLRYGFLRAGLTLPEEERQRSLALRHDGRRPTVTAPQGSRMRGGSPWFSPRGLSSMHTGRFSTSTR
jgi:D-alanyl-D-alanine carboxypeptidase